jgi:hypothetical protein
VDDPEQPECYWCGGPGVVHTIRDDPARFPGYVLCDGCHGELPEDLGKTDTTADVDAVVNWLVERVLDPKAPIPGGRVNYAFVRESTLRWAVGSGWKNGSHEAWGDTWPVPAGADSRRDWESGRYSKYGGRTEGVNLHDLPDAWPNMPEDAWIGLAVSRLTPTGSVWLLGALSEPWNPIAGDWYWAPSWTYLPVSSRRPWRRSPLWGRWEAARMPVSCRKVAAELMTWYASLFEGRPVDPGGRPSIPTFDTGPVQALLDEWQGPPEAAAVVRALELEIENPPTLKQVRHALQRGWLGWRTRRS